MPKGGRRHGAGRKPRSPQQHFLSGNAGKLASVPVSREAVTFGDGAAGLAPPARSEPEVWAPQARLQKDEQAYWDGYAPSAQAAGTLTSQTEGGFVLLCQVAARADRVWAVIERDGFTSAVDGLIKAHPLWPAYRGLVQRQESLLQRYLLAAMAKPDLAAAPPPKEDDDSAALRQIMAIQ